MSLLTKHLGGTDDEPVSIEVSGRSFTPSKLLWHLCKLPGLKVVAKKSLALTDDYEAYFTYKGRLFVIYTPMVDVWVSLIGQPPDNEIFSEVEAHVQNYQSSFYFTGLIASIRFLFTPFNPSQKLLQKHEMIVGK